jgi:hypothetical protein
VPPNACDGGVSSGTTNFVENTVEPFKSLVLPDSGNTS